MNAYNNQPGPVRQGAELPIANLSEYLCRQLGPDYAIREVRQFPGGYSNLTYLLLLRQGELILRRPPPGADIKGAHDMGREFAVLSALEGHFQLIPKPVLYTEDAAIIGAPFFLMERVSGLILRGAPGAPGFDAVTMQHVSEAVVDTLATLHRTPIQTSALAQLGKPEGYTDRQLKGWIERYTRAATDTVPEMAAVAEWLPLHLPSASPAALIHNDFKYDNLVLDPEKPERIRAVLDWEMATLGDPWMDLGTTLAYWTEPREAQQMPLAAATLTWLPGNLNRQGVLERYQQQSAHNTPDILFYFAFGAFKVGVIIQQIYARYQQGLSSDERFAGLGKAVQHFGRMAAAAIDQQKISDLRF
jgi:aminoglycoside phosphotransferase (APT) family kinase protein